MRSSHSMSPCTVLAYGSNSSLAGLHRNPGSGSHGPWTRNPYRVPTPSPGTNPCHTPASYSRSGTRSSDLPPSPASVMTHRSTASATSEATAKLVPPSPGVAPRGNGRPGHTSDDMRLIQPDRTRPGEGGRSETTGSGTAERAVGAEARRRRGRVRLQTGSFVERPREHVQESAQRCQVAGGGRGQRRLHLVVP